MNNINYQREMEKIIADNNGDKKKLLLHSCCGPCSASVLETLSAHFDVSILYYNPNIYPEAEYLRRASEQKKLVSQIYGGHIKVIELDYFPNEFYEAVKGLESIAEGGERCFACFNLRLECAAMYAKENGFDYFTTTLTVSPHKNAAKLNEIGFLLAKKYDMQFLPSDFKKKNGFKRSMEISNQYNLYRQEYCGCVFSYNERGL